jgi:hypothetical protein
MSSLLTGCKWSLLTLIVILAGAGLGFSVHGQRGLAIGAAAALTIFLIDVLRTGAILRGRITSEEIEFHSYHLRQLNDPSAHLFITRAPFQTDSVIWITRGLLSLLPENRLAMLVTAGNLPDVDFTSLGGRAAPAHAERAVRK